MNDESNLAQVMGTQSGQFIDTRYFLDTFGADSAACDELVALFVRVSGQQMRALHVARSDADWLRVGREAHGLKGSLGVFGARSTIQLLQDLEWACEEGDTPRITECLDILGRSMAHIVAEVSALTSRGVEMTPGGTA